MKKDIFPKIFRMYLEFQFLFYLFMCLLLFNFASSSSCHMETNKDGYMLPMYFSNNIQIKFLFDYFEVKNIYQFIICNIICVLLGALSIIIKILKKRVDSKKLQHKQDNMTLKNIFSWYNFIYSLLFFFNYTIDYLLMLIVMNFNPFIFLSIMIGLSSMYFFWGHLM